MVRLEYQQSGQYPYRNSQDTDISVANKTRLILAYTFPFSKVKNCLLPTLTASPPHPRGKEVISFSEPELQSDVSDRYYRTSTEREVHLNAKGLAV